MFEKLINYYQTSVFFLTLQINFQQVGTFNKIKNIFLKCSKNRRKQKQNRIFLQRRAFQFSLKEVALCKLMFTF